MPRSSKSGVRGLFRGKDGRWNIDLRWRHPSTGEWQRHRERLPGHVAAVAAKHRAREILNAALEGKFNPDREAPRRLRDAFTEYDKWCQSNRPAAAKKREAATKRLLDGIGDVRIDEVSPFHVERFKRHRLSGGAKPATVNRDLEVLSHFFGLAASWSWVLDAQARAVRDVPHLKEPPGRVRYLSADEEGRLMAELPAGIRPIVTASLLSGMRQSEVVLLRKDAVDLDSRVITLTRTKANKVRRVYVNDALAEVLESAMAKSRGPYVFTSRSGDPYTPDGLRSIFRRAVARAKIENFRFHDTRHTTATRLRQRGVGLDAIADVLGHATLTMARRYAHLGVDTLRDAMNCLPPPAAAKAADKPVAQPLPNSVDAASLKAVK